MERVVDKRIVVKNKQIKPLDLRIKFQPFNVKTNMGAVKLNVDYDEIKKGNLIYYNRLVLIKPAEPIIKKECRNCESMNEFVINLQLEIKRLQYIT